MSLKTNFTDCFAEKIYLFLKILLIISEGNLV